MTLPVLLTQSTQIETFGGLQYEINGHMVPVLQVTLNDTPIYFDHYLLLWKEPSVQIDLKPQTKSLRRTRSGAPVFLTEAKGPGRIALSRNGAGQAFTIHLRAGKSIDVHEHQFVAATDNVEFSCKRLKGAATILFGGTSFTIETFTCARGEGIVWLHGYGDVFEAALDAGEQIDIEPGGWIYKEHAVQIEPIHQRLATAILSGEQVAWHRFTGPGKVALQSMYLHQTVNVAEIMKSAKYE